jgi:hypothetical protein
MPQDCPLSKLGNSEHHAQRIMSIGKVLLYTYFLSSSTPFLPNKYTLLTALTQCSRSLQCFSDSTCPPTLYTHFHERHPPFLTRVKAVVQ